jgi:hypothetical protein
MERCREGRLLVAFLIISPSCLLLCKLFTGFRLLCWVILGMDGSLISRFYWLLVLQGQLLPMLSRIPGAYLDTVKNRDKVLLQQ